VSSLTPAPRFDRDDWLRPRTPLARARLALLISLIVLTAAAWAATLQQASTMPMGMGIAVRETMENSGMGSEMDSDGMGDMAMTGMASDGWSLPGGATFVAIWTVMMAAMMLPAAAPMLLIFNSAHAGRSGRSAIAPTWIFAAGYLLVWLTAGIAVYIGVQIGSDLATTLAPADRVAWAPIALGVTLIVAGLYQFTPLKGVCLSHCRSPLGFVMEHWREGRWGALQMGIRHGAYCFGCCWALFAVLVATGIMSLAWMLLLTLVVFAEKVLPLGHRASQVVGVAFVVLGAAVAVGAADLPWVV
jgi:predicted metal-binding membrane protein